MVKQIFNYFDIAAKLTTSKNDNRAFLLGSVAVRNDGVLVTAINSPTEFPNRQVHSEYRISKKIDHKATIYVVRVRLKDNQFAMARPCLNCQKALICKKVHRVYYTISQIEWGYWNPSTGEDKIFTKKQGILI